MTKRKIILLTLSALAAALCICAVCVHLWYECLKTAKQIPNGWEINGAEYAFESKMVERDEELTGNQWLARNYVCVVIGEVDLSLGENSIEFSQKGYAGTIMDKIDLVIAA